MNEYPIAKAWDQMLTACFEYKGPLPGLLVGSGWQRFSVFRDWGISQWRRPTMSRRWSQGTPRFQEEPQLVLTPGAIVYCPWTCKWVMR